MLPLLPATVQGPTDTPLAPIAQGHFRGTLESLKNNRYPRWFTEGKLGIWAHWGPKSVPMEGDWYARQMYEEGSPKYKDHLARFGHPSEKGFKDIIPQWRAERWNPDRLMGLYKAAGARYFVSMAAHHDNFDLWNSQGHRWNSVHMGPHRNVVAEWQRAAKRHGLRFGVSEHLGASWTWFQTAHGADKEGAYKGVPYDGNDPANEDLYHPKALSGDTDWYTTDPRWHREWYARVKDLIDQHHPDLLYTDGALPFGEVGASIVAHLYNTNRESVYACKQTSEGRWATDVERGVMAGIQEYPWQTDTSIGDWYYNKHWQYRGADWVVHTLVDVVSKNGNLLINVVQRPDGSLDPEAEKVLADMAAWMKTNGESIYGTTPWLVYGEGATRAKGGAFKEDFGFTANDVRYVQKGDGMIYATLMGKPGSREVSLVSLSKGPGDTAAIQNVSLLGTKGKVEWNWDAGGLHATLPEGERSDIATVFKITGRDLRGFHSIPLPAKPPVPVVSVTNGEYRLNAELADLGDGKLATELRGIIVNLGFWDDPKDQAAWTVDFTEPGTYEAFATVASLETTALEVELGDQKATLSAAPTGAWDRFVELPVGTFRVTAVGKVRVVARPSDPSPWRPLNLIKLLFRKVP